MIPNNAKGRLMRFGQLPDANDAILWVIFTGSETDANVRDADDLAALIALSLNEATFTGYARVTATSVTVTVDDPNDRVDLDAADPQWSPTTAEAVTRIGANYDPDTTGGTDSSIIPLFVDDFAFTTPTSGTITYSVAAGGFGRAS